MLKLTAPRWGHSTPLPPPNAAASEQHTSKGFKMAARTQDPCFRAFALCLRLLARASTWTGALLMPAAAVVDPVRLARSWLHKGSSMNVLILQAISAADSQTG